MLDRSTGMLRTAGRRTSDRPRPSSRHCRPQHPPRQPRPCRLRTRVGRATVTGTRTATTRP